jgi:hypothetical protein
LPDKNLPHLNNCTKIITAVAMHPLAAFSDIHPVKSSARYSLNMYVIDVAHTIISMEALNCKSARFNMKETLKHLLYAYWVVFL